MHRVWNWAKSVGQFIRHGVNLFQRRKGGHAPVEPQTQTTVGHIIRGHISRQGHVNGGRFGQLRGDGFARLRCFTLFDGVGQQPCI